jgi:hypothetical protein
MIGISPAAIAKEMIGVLFEYNIMSKLPEVIAANRLGEALANAAGLGYIDIMGMLLSRGAEANYNNGLPLVSAAMAGHAFALEVLAKNGANIKTFGATAISAALSGSLESSTIEIIIVLKMKIL